MYYISKNFELSCAHKVEMSDPALSEEIHGHNYNVTVYCKSAELNADGMVEDFRIIKNRIHKVLDHKYLNDVIPYTTTSENIARWIAEQIPHCYKVRVEETAKNVAVYTVDGFADSGDVL